MGVRQKGKNQGKRGKMRKNAIFRVGGGPKFGTLRGCPQTSDPCQPMGIPNLF